MPNPRGRTGRVRLLIGNSALSTRAEALLLRWRPSSQPTDFLSSKIGWIPTLSPHFQDGQLSHHGLLGRASVHPQSGSGLIGSESPSRPVAGRGVEETPRFSRLPKARPPLPRADQLPQRPPGSLWGLPKSAHRPGGGPGPFRWTSSSLK